MDATPGLWNGDGQARFPVHRIGGRPSPNCRRLAMLHWQDWSPPLPLAAPPAALTRTPHFYATLVDAMPDPILVVTGADREDLSGRRFVLANAAARELLRLTSEEGLLL